MSLCEKTNLIQNKFLTSSAIISLLCLHNMRLPVFRDCVDPVEWCAEWVVQPSKVIAR